MGKRRGWSVEGLFAAVRKRRIERIEDEAYHWLELREAGLIDPEAPWPFGAYFDPPASANPTEEATDA